MGKAIFIYHREDPLPICHICKKQMDYWVPGLPDSEHAHPACEGAALADQFMERIRNEVHL